MSNAFAILMLLLSTVLFALSGYSSGYIVKVHFYNHERGELDSRGLKNEKVRYDRVFHILLISNFIIPPLGIFYLLGWYLAKDEGYISGFKFGEDVQIYMDSVARDLLESYNEFDLPGKPD